jgi:hypothetical protein
VVSGDPAADEVNDLKPVTVIKRSFRPAVARDDIAIELDCHAIRFHAESFDESEKRGGSGIEVALFAIDVELHVKNGGEIAAHADCNGSGCYSALRKANFRVVVRPSKFA